MSTTNRNRTGYVAAAGVAAVLVGIVLYAVWSRPPQMGASEEVFQTVDALYTAVRNRDVKRVGECERRLHTYRDAGRLPPDAADALDAVVKKTRSGSWDAATRRLYEFMLAQRREGPVEPRPPTTKTVASKR